MAISGSGTQADPYVVHDWDEFVSVMPEGSHIEGGGCINLANDIQAPSTNVNLDMKYLGTLDGQGYAITGLLCTSGNCLQPTNFKTPNKTIKNIKFKNIHMDGGNVFLYTDLGNDRSVTLENVTFSGMFESGWLTDDAVGLYTGLYTANGVGLNLEVYTPNFRLIGLNDNNKSMSGNFVNVNGTIEYMGCSPSVPLFDKTNGRKVLKNSTVEIVLPSTGAKLDMGATLDNCCIYGSGAGIIVESATGVSVIENTLTLETSLENVYSVPTSEIKDPQKLHDYYHFPIGVN